MFASSCGGDSPTSPSATTETISPYPALADFVRSDIGESNHVEVTRNGRSAKVTQIAFPEDVTAQVYRTGVYASSGQNPTTNARDNVFSNGVANELLTITGGDPATGYGATFQVGIAL